MQELEFKSKYKFPPIKLLNGSSIEIHTDEDNYRIKDAFSNAKSDKSPAEKFFWFRISGFNSWSFGFEFLAINTSIKYLKIE
jgi:hypothetical protein